MAAPATIDAVLDDGGFRALIHELQLRGYVVIGPAVRDGAINWQRIESADELPCGWTVEQKPGSYRLKPRDDERYFGYANGPAGLKRFLHHPEARLYSVQRNGEPFHIVDEQRKAPRRAFVGVRACDLAALKILDRVLLEDRYPDALYQHQREEAFIVAASCTDPSPNCFCSSMNAGPEIESGYDLLLTELQDGRFVARAATEAGGDVLSAVPHRQAAAEDRAAATAAIAEGRGKITKRFDPAAARETLYNRFEHPAWDRAAARCFGCGSCTQVCPTCFCVTVEDTSDIDGSKAERWRKWDSCFTLSYSYIHGGSVRQSAKSRYRQWANHKFAAWYDQFGSAGCSGCGRCVTWCPAGIDVVEVLAEVVSG